MKGYILVLIACLLAGSCTDTEKKQESQNTFEQERQELIHNLQELSLDIDKRIKVVEHHIDKGSETTKLQLRKVKKDLKEQKLEIDRALNKAEKSSTKTWDNVRRGARNAYENGKVSVERITNSIKEEFD
jgi:hypothetical protein